MIKTQVKKLREKLLKRKEILMASARSRKEPGTSGDVGDEADAANDALSKEMTFEFTDMERQILDDIEAALIKMERGTYGLCERCNKPVAFARLRAMPFTRHCIKCQSASESPRE